MMIEVTHMARCAARLPILFYKCLCIENRDTASGRLYSSGVLRMDDCYSVQPWNKVRILV